MSRGTMAADRLAMFVAAVLAIGLGGLALLWWSGQWSALPDRLDVSGALDVLDQPWWPWAAALAGLALLLLGTWWLVGHVRSQAVGRLTLPGSGRTGRLQADAGSVAKAAGEALSKVRGVRSSRATITHDRGQIVARLLATIDPDADLSSVASAADRVSGELRQVLGRDDVLCRVQLKVSTRSSTMPRVE